MPIFLKVNHQLESRVQEICQSGSEGGAKHTFVPTPIAVRREIGARSLAVLLALFQHLQPALRAFFRVGASM
jgi:hypothetical protein